MRDIFVTAVIFGILPFVFKRPWVGILLWTWLAYMNPQRQAWGFAYNFPFSLIVAVVTISAFLFSKDKKEMLWTRETILLAIFVGWMFVTTIFAFYPDLAWVHWNKVWKIQLMVFLIVLVIKDRHQIHWMVWVIALSLGYYGTKGGVFTIIHGGQFRVQGPADTFIGGNNEMALALVMTIPLMRYLHLQETRKWVKLGLAGAMVLTGVAAIGSQSRGALLAMLLMGLFLWLKSRNKFFTGIMMILAVSIMAAVMPQKWYDRMDTIETYQTDASAMGRINAWHTAFNVAKHNVMGGGFNMFQAGTFRQYAPDPWNVRDVHSIYFEQIGEQGFIGFSMFMLLGVLTWGRAGQIIKRCKMDPDKKWAADLAAMIQVSLIGYGTGGAFLGLSYWDMPYNLVMLVVLTAKFSGVLEKQTSAVGFETVGRAPPDPSPYYRRDPRHRP